LIRAGGNQKLLFFTHQLATMHDEKENKDVNFYPGQRINIAGKWLRIKEISSVKGMKGKYIIFTDNTHPIRLKTAKKWVWKYDWFTVEDKIKTSRRS